MMIREAIPIHPILMTCPGTKNSPWRPLTCSYLPLARRYVTPDHDPDPATSSLSYRGRVPGTNALQEFVSFYDVQDSALGAWEVNNQLTKPQPLFLGLDGHYFYTPTNSSGEKLGLQFNTIMGRNMTDKYEAMAYADKAITKTMGTEIIGGLVNTNIDLNANYGVNTDHCAEFNFPIQEDAPLVYDLLFEFNTPQNYLSPARK